MGSTVRIASGAKTIGWLARWRDPAGVQRKKTFARKADADRWLANVEAQKASGSYVDLHSRVTVAEYARQWAATRPHRPGTAQRTDSLIRNHLEGTRLGARRLAEVRPSEVQAWTADRAQHLAPTTMRLLVGLLRSVYGAAVLDRLVAASPVVKVALARHEKERVVPLTVPQVRSLAGAMPPRCRALVLAQAGLGLRLGELLALRVEDVDFLHRSVQVDGQFAPDGRTRVEPKTPRSRRTVPLPDVVGEALAQHIAAYPPRADGTIFLDSNGAAWRSNNYGSALFGAAVKRAGLPPGTTTHDLRHHYASVLIHAGESVVTVTERLGHENAVLVMTTYAHIMPDTEERTRAAVDAAWAENSLGATALRANEGSPWRG